MIRLLVVDDSTFFRYAIKSIVEPDADIELAGEAKNGLEALNMVEELKPDVVTMDVEMPDMDGIKATKAIMERWPCPIIMVSNYTQANSSATIEALEYGAVDFISKKSNVAKLELSRVNNELLEKIHYWGTQKIRFYEGRFKNLGTALQPAEKAAVPEPAALPGPITPVETVDLVVIAISTGGPGLMREFLKYTGALDCPVVIAQHMPARFTTTFADHLASNTGLTVCEGKTGMELVPGTVYIAPGEMNCTIIKDDDGRLVLRVLKGPDTPYKPSGDLLFMSAAAVAQSPVALIMTGMGNDGTRGAKEFIKRGYPVLCQSLDTCVVSGMPKAAMDAGAVNEELSPGEISERLKDWTGAGGKEKSGALPPQ